LITNFQHTAATLLLRNGDTFGLQPGTNQVVTDIKGWHGSAGIRRKSTPKLWQHGIFPERGWKTERVISLQGHISTATRGEAADLCDSLAAILGDGTFGTFTVDDADQGLRTAEVQLDGPVEIGWDSGTEIDVTVDMVAPDPRKYGPLQSFTTGASMPGGGLDNDPSLFNNETDVLDFGEGGTSGTITIINAGKAPAAVAFEAQGYWPDEIIITEVGTGRRLRYILPNLIEDTLYLDGAAGTVMLNGVADRSEYLVERGWPVLNPGTNTYLFEAPDASVILTARAASAWW
jgi:hypothetical protein